MQRGEKRKLTETAKESTDTMSRRTPIWNQSNEQLNEASTSEQRIDSPPKRTRNENESNIIAAILDPYGLKEKARKSASLLAKRVPRRPNIWDNEPPKPTIQKPSGTDYAIIERRKEEDRIKGSAAELMGSVILDSSIRIKTEPLDLLGASGPIENISHLSIKRERDDTESECDSMSVATDRMAATICTSTDIDGVSTIQTLVAEPMINPEDTDRIVGTFYKPILGNSTSHELRIHERKEMILASIMNNCVTIIQGKID